MNKFVKYLVKKRVELGLTQKALAKEIGWTAMYYGRFEKGQLKPTKANYKIFCELLNISEEELIRLIKEEEN